MKKIDELIGKFKEFKDELNKNDKPDMGHSSFTMDHVNAVVKMPHREAQQYAHKAVDESTANPHNKAKMKRMIMSSKNSSHLAQGMSNHILAHPSEGLRVAKGEKLCMSENGQWKLDKVDPQENVNIPHPKKAPKMAQDPKHTCEKCGKGPCECA